MDTGHSYSVITAGGGAREIATEMHTRLIFEIPSQDIEIMMNSEDLMRGDRTRGSAASGSSTNHFATDAYQA